MTDPREADRDLPDEHDTLPPSQDPHAGGGVIEPPRTLGGILRQLGPGLIIAGSIVGSGELIATTKTGAQAGITLLWLIAIGCVIKIFVQIELGRYAITHGETTLSALDRVPGPRLKANWIVWAWLAMMIAGVGQLGGIVGGVGQALALAIPITGDYADAIRVPSEKELLDHAKWQWVLLTEWDLQLAYGSGGNDTQWRKLAKHKTLRRLDWARENVARDLDQQLLSVIRVDKGQSADDAGNAEAERKRRQLLERINTAWIERGDGSDVAFKFEVSDFRELSPAQQRRVRRGHHALAEQLAELDRDDRDPFRASRAMQAAIDANTAAAISSEEVAAQERKELNALVEPQTWDDKYWAALVTLITVAVLFRGRYNLIQNFSLVLVVSFTFITIGNVLSLQASEKFHIPPEQFLHGLSFRLPEKLGGIDPLVTAVATFGIIGVGASELITYPYWCLEKGYAKFTGERNASESWARRARGWMRVMHYDAALSMVVYTVATLAFFVMGVAVLHNEGRDPDGMRMVSTLATAYVPVFGEYAKWLFLCGAFAVLYSTFLVASAGHARMYTDGLKIFGLLSRNNEKAHDRSITVFGILVPLSCLAVYCAGINPVAAIVLAGLAQAILLPMIGFGALYFRRTATDPRLRPSPAWDVALVVSFLGLLVVGAWGVYKEVASLF